MPDPLYFQWQNEVLLKTIYPLREMKLRDFLVYYQEIDLWAQYKDKPIEDLQADVQAYIAARENAAVTAFKSYRSLYAYFTREDVRTQYMAKYKLRDETQLAKVKELHRTLLTYLPKYADVRKEKYFVTQQVLAWEQYRKDLAQQIVQKQRRINAMVPEHPRRPLELQELQTLQKTTLAIADEELGRLYTFVSTYNKIEKRKLEYYKARQAAETSGKSLQTKLDRVSAQLEPLLAKQKELAAALARLKTPPALAPLQTYFCAADVTGQLRQKFPQADAAMLTALNDVHKQLAAALPTIKDDTVKLVTVKNHFFKLQEQQRSFQKEGTMLESQLHSMPPTWTQRAEKQARLAAIKEAGLPALAAETEKLGDYQAALEYSKMTAAQIAKLVKARETEMLGVQQSSSGLGKEAADLKAQLDLAQAALNMTEEEFLVRFIPDQPITVKDIVRGKVDEYKASLASKTHFELLEEIVRRFVSEPQRFPLWLQYMVIHFSGMRYATAHGSWADPKDLLLSLRTSDLEKEFKQMDDDAVEAMAQERIGLYEGAGNPGPGTPKLAQTQDAKWKDKIAFHLRGLKSPGVYYQRKALFDLRLDEDNYEIETMTPAKALDELEAIKDTLPEWMWKEIVKLTDLRVQEVNDPNWEKLTQDEQEQRDEAQYAGFRDIMNKWKQANLTGWREEHERTDQLIVTRSVCNEVAEQIQHLRGYAPPGGLTAKAPWYLKNERDGTIKGTPRPYLTRPVSAKDYTVGASILWLRFIHELPNPWRIAHPLQTKSGDGLIPAAYLARTDPDDWTYVQSDMVTRTRTRTNENKQTVKEQQWLRWIHEATVAEVAETADGPVVLTFETALPYDDPRMSAIGVFKHDLASLMFDGGEESYNGSFVGYLPEGQAPASNLAEMLDWNRILLKPFMTQAQWEDYCRKYIVRSEK